MARKAGQLISRGPRTWLVRVSLGRDPETGIRKYHNKTVRGSFREAQTYLSGKLQEREIGRVHGEFQIQRQTESGTCLDNDSATGRNQNSVETRMIPSDPAIARSIRSASGEHYSNVESRAVSSPDRSCSRTASDPGIRAGWSQSVSPQTDVKAGRREAF